MDSHLLLPACALAVALGAHYKELDLRGGHMWMLADRTLLATAVSD